MAYPFITIGLTIMFIVYTIYLLLKKKERIQIPFISSVPFLRDLDFRLLFLVKAGIKLVFLIVFIAYCTPESTAQKSGELYGNVKSVREIVYLAEEESGVPTLIMLLNTKVLEYDKNGRHLNTKHYRSNEKELEYIWVYHYNENGVKTEVNGHFYSESSEVDMKFTFHYDDKGEEAEQLTFDKDGELTAKLTYIYDSIGNKVEMVQVNNKGEWLNSLNLKYDKHGNVTEEISSATDRKLNYKDTFQYEFDTRNNWIRQLHYRNGRLAQIAERTIIYE